LAKTRQEKQDQIMTQVLKNSTPQKWYSAAQLAGIFTESMEPTLNQVGDQMPPGALYGTRSKLIHTQGAVASVKLTNSGEHPFTGVFESADTGIVRLSVAAQPDTNVQELAPGMALKFLRDGIDSSSLVAMYSVDGQESWNFFENDFTTHIPAAQSISLLPLAAKFNTATDYIQAIGVSDWAQHKSDGLAVDDVHFPFSMRFHPTGEFEFSQTWSGTYFLDQLATIPEGSTLYEVYGMSAPEELGGKEYFIGNLVSTSALTSSNWGDNGLFFRHQWAEADVAAMPEWEPYYPFYGNKNAVGTVAKHATKAIKGCPFAHLFQ